MTGGQGTTSGARQVVRAVVRLPRRLLVLLIRGYQRFLSPLTPPTCRFHPSCSAYAVIALERHGVVRGTRLAVWRILRCNPWNPGGVDDVPPAAGRTVDTPAVASAH